MPTDSTNTQHQVDLETLSIKELAEAVEHIIQSSQEQPREHLDKASLLLDDYKKALEYNAPMAYTGSLSEEQQQESQQIRGAITQIQDFHGTNPVIPKDFDKAIAEAEGTKKELLEALQESRDRIPPRDEIGSEGDREKRSEAKQAYGQARDEYLDFIRETPLENEVDSPLHNIGRPIKNASEVDIFAQQDDEAKNSPETEQTPEALAVESVNKLIDGIDRIPEDQLPVIEIDGEMTPITKDTVITADNVDQVYTVISHLDTGTNIVTESYQSIVDVKKGISPAESINTPPDQYYYQDPATGNRQPISEADTTFIENSLTDEQKIENSNRALDGQATVETQNDEVATNNAATTEEEKEREAIAAESHVAGIGGNPEEIQNFIAAIIEMLEGFHLAFNGEETEVANKGEIPEKPENQPNPKETAEKPTTEETAQIDTSEEVVDKTKIESPIAGVSLAQYEANTATLQQNNTTVIAENDEPQNLFTNPDAATVENTNLYVNPDASNIIASLPKDMQDSIKMFNKENLGSFSFASDVNAEEIGLASTAQSEDMALLTGKGGGLSA